MLQYQIDRNDKNIYPMGLTIIKGGIHLSVMAAAKSCSLVLFACGTGKKEEPVRIPFPEEDRIGNVWEMTVKMCIRDRVCIGHLSVLP